MVKESAGSWAAQPPLRRKQRPRGQSKPRRWEPQFSGQKNWIPGFTRSWPWQNSVSESEDRRKIPDDAVHDQTSVEFWPQAFGNEAAVMVTPKKRSSMKRPSA